MPDSKFDFNSIFGNIFSKLPKKGATAPPTDRPKAKTGSVLVLVSSDGNVEIHGEFKSLTVNGKLVRFTKPA